MEYNERVIENKRYLEIDYPIGNLCWFRDYRGYKYCGHLCGFMCVDWENMKFQYCVDVGSSIYNVDKIYKTEQEVNQI